MSERQTIFRAAHGKDQPYFLLRRATAQDSRLSFEARGIVCYLLSKPDNWEITEAHLRNEGNIGRDKMKKLIAELAETGYITKEQQRDEGKYAQNVYLLHEIPLTENPSTVPAPLPEKPCTVSPSTEKPHLHNTESLETIDPQKLQNQESSEENQITDPSPSPNTDSSGESTRAPSPDSAAGDGDEVWALIDPEIRKLHLNPARKEALKARGPVQALAIAWAAQNGHTPGGLAVSLMDTGGPPDDQLERAEAAVKLKTLNPRTLDSHINHRDLATLSETVTERAHREQDSTSRPQSEQQQKPPALLGAIPPGVYDEFTRILKTMLAHPPGEWVFDVMPQRYETAAKVLHVVSSGAPDAVEMVFAGTGLAVQAAQVETVEVTV